MSGAPLRLGRFEKTGQEYLFDGNESLITLARPGRGKSQAHVIRNLLYLHAPAFVLDVKPEIYDATAAWRGREVGPVIRFAPSLGAASETFNPLDAIPGDPVDAYKVIQRLIPLLMVPPDNKAASSFWEDRAGQLLGAALYDVAMHASGRRDMTAVVDWFSPSDEELADCVGRLIESELRVLQRVGNQLQSMPEKVRESIFETARRSIEVWGAPELDDVVASTSIDLAQLRRSNGTLYLCVTPEELVSYASLIRTLFGMALFTIREAREDWHGPPVTFFMDEFPQLGYMREVEQMLALGRQSGLRLWLFAQTKGQIQDAYRDADRLLDMLAVRCFMEPTAKLAAELSKELGTYRDIWKGTERPLATAQELAGPDYVNKTIVLEGGRAPARLDTIMAFADPALRGRLST